MPIYTYFCKACKKNFDFLVRQGEQKVSCPDCGGTDLEKLFSPFGIVSKGSQPSTYTSSNKCSSCSGGNCSTCS